MLAVLEEKQFVPPGTGAHFESRVEPSRYE